MPTAGAQLVSVCWSLRRRGRWALFPRARQWDAGGEAAGALLQMPSRGSSAKIWSHRWFPGSPRGLTHPAVLTDSKENLEANRYLLGTDHVSYTLYGLLQSAQQIWGLCLPSHQQRRNTRLLRLRPFSQKDHLRSPEVVSCTRALDHMDKWGLKSSHSRDVKQCPEGAFTNLKRSPREWPSSCLTGRTQFKLRLVQILNWLSCILHPCLFQS